MIHQTFLVKKLEQVREPHVDFDGRDVVGTRKRRRLTQLLGRQHPALPVRCECGTSASRSDSTE